ncbi:MAG TPA: glycosyltransferase family 2 protein, partial [Verrucomicrobiaceae bacterium]
TDQTGAVMDEVAREDPRLVVLHKTEPPPLGWTGKNHALWSGQRQARGEWLLFVDSDVVLEKDALSTAISVVLRKQFDMISLLPRLEGHSLWERVLVPLAGGAASTMYLIALTNNAQLDNCAFANGQFLMISRKAYDIFGGHEVVRDRFCEDIEIAVQLKKHGLRPRISWGNDFASVRMYSSLDGIIRGWSRIYYAARVGSPWRILAAIEFLIVSCFTAFVATIFGAISIVQHGVHHNLGAALCVAGLAHLAIMGHFLGAIYRWSGNSRWNALLFPLGGPMLLWILLRALKMCITRKVEWRGTAYSHTMAQNLAAAAKSE